MISRVQVGARGKQGCDAATLAVHGGSDQGGLSLLILRMNVRTVFQKQCQDLDMTASGSFHKGGTGLAGGAAGHSLLQQAPDSVFISGAGGCTELPFQRLSLLLVHFYLSL
jgi:hypothetical protein